MLWVMVALIEPFCHAIANVIDNYLVNRLFRDPVMLLFFSSVTNLVFLPLIFLFGVPVIPSAAHMLLLALLGLINVGYIFPYYKALQNDDTSTVSSLFSMTKILVPVLAFLVVGELLTAGQYAGFLMIVAASTLLTFNYKSGISFNSSFFYMAVASLLISFEVVLYKYVLADVSWITALTWSSVFSFLFATVPLLYGSRVKMIRKAAPVFRKNFRMFVTNEFFAFAGLATSIFALSLAPVTLVRAVASVQPVFVLFFAVVFGRRFSKMFRENVSRSSVIKKIALFIAIIAGGILIVG